MFVQQGDVIFTRIERVPDKAMTRIASRVLVEGEHTGHSHVLSGEASVLTDGYTLYVIVGDPVEVVHPEHGIVTLDPGIWQVGRVQEYDHFAEEARDVQD